MSRASVIAGAVCLALGAAACGGGSGAATSSASSPPATATARPSSTAALTIVTPKIGASVTGSPLDVKVNLEGATVVTTTSTDLQPDEGHLHVILDDQIVSMTAETQTTIPDVAPGHHILKVEFVANDHGPFFPNISAVTSFEVTA